MDSLTSLYRQNGFVTAVPILSGREAADARHRLEATESQHGPMHYRNKIHTAFRLAYELATHDSMLELAETALGPDLLLYNVTFIIKEPHTEAFVSWHQDLTYWGLSSAEQVSLWLALSPATAASGAMTMLPRSHVNGRRKHQVGADDQNVLYQAQTVIDVDEEHAVLCSLEPGQASAHHGWLLHRSDPNRSDDRRIGLNVQYLNPSVRQLKDDADTALLVRGVDRFRHFDTDLIPAVELDKEALSRQAQLDAAMKSRYEAPPSTPTG